MCKLRYKQKTLDGRSLGLCCEQLYLSFVKTRHSSKTMFFQLQSFYQLQELYLQCSFELSDTLKGELVQLADDFATG